MFFFSYVFILSDSLLILQVMEHFTSEKPVIYHQVYIHIGLKIQKPKVGTSSGAQEKNKIFLVIKIHPVTVSVTIVIMFI